MLCCREKCIWGNKGDVEQVRCNALKSNPALFGRNLLIVLYVSRLLVTTMMMTMEMVVMTTMLIMIDDDDKHTCESAIGVRRGEDELI